jgi:hypothetical protein
MAPFLRAALLAALLAAPAAAEESRSLTALPSYVFSDIKSYTRQVFRRESAAPAIGLAAATGALIFLDEPIYAESQRVGRRLGLGNKDNTTPYIKVGNIPVFRGPSDTGSALYFLGDGWTHFGICGGFYAYGWLADNPRALRTGYALLEGLGTTAVVTQILKRSTGRESPFVSTAENGRWRFFPNQNTYSRHVAKYDAFPSGHLATAMMTVTVISSNYPEYPAIKPVGYGLMTLLSFQMMNNGVHWASDYPLALSIGYSLGKLAARRSRGEAPAPGKDGGVTLLPVPVGDGAGLMLLARL